MTSVIGYITLYSVFVGTTGFVCFLYKIKKKNFEKSKLSSGKEMSVLNVTMV